MSRSGFVLRWNNLLVTKRRGDNVIECGCRERTSDTLESFYNLFPEREGEAQRGEVTVIKANLGLEPSSLKSWVSNSPTVLDDKEKLYLSLEIVTASSYQGLLLMTG